MKIAMLTTSYPKWAGETTAPFIEEIAAGMARRGHEVHVVAPYHPELRRQDVERGVHLHFFRYAPRPSLNIWGYAAALKADVGLKRAAALVAPLALTASLWSLLRRCAGQGYDLIHGHWVLPNGLPALVAARLLRLPLVISLHGSDVYVAERALPAALVARTIFRGAQAVTACSGDLAARAVGLGARPAAMTTLPYGVDPDCFSPQAEAGRAFRERVGVGHNTPLIVAWGRMVYKKGFSYLIDALPEVRRRCPETTLLLAGYGDLEQQLRHQAAGLGLERAVLFPGSVARDSVPAMINAADVVAVPSVHDQRGNVDGLPNVLLEAMSTGRPIVASAIAGIPSVIDHDQCGVLVPEQDAQALAGGIVRLLREPDFAQRLGHAARARVERELNWPRYAERLEEVYRLALRP